jgi:signal transduction histidine kinase/ActR/RegA family two-component response regulator/putative methionine-R-sulfoxide reductase with GAF domain
VGTPDERGPGSPTAGPESTKARLRHDLADATSQLAATTEVLTALGQSGRDPGGVLDTIVQRAAALCRADASQVYLVDGDVLRLSRRAGHIAQRWFDRVSEQPLAISRDSFVGRAAVERTTQQIADVLADPEYGRQDLQQAGGFRSLVSAPMLVEDDVVGVLLVWRTTVEPFDPRAIQLLEAFAAQAAIAVRHVGLMRTLEARSAELASKVDQLEALSEVGEVVRSSLDLDEVLVTIVTNAVRLTGTDGGSLMEYDEASGVFFVRCAYGSSQALLDRLQEVRIERDTTLVGRATLDRRPLEVADLDAAPLDPHLQALYDDGWRSVLAVPLLRHEEMLGALVIRRRTTGSFSSETLELLQTFASQSALAIVNARLFRELATKSAELEVASQHKSEFLASMSHELRTPLNAVIGFSEVLLDQMFGPVNERQAEYLRDIWTSGRHLLELLNEILDLSKVEAGHMQMDYSTFDVARCLDYGLSLMRERAGQHGIELRLDVASDVGLIEADELRLKQVVVNLLTNAVKFTPDGGHVVVGARRDGADLVVSVADDGIGVPAEDRERIFASFQQGRRGAPKEEGTGLGLTLSRRIVELLGGRLWLESEVGVGSTFAFCVPLRQKGVSESQADDTTESAGIRPSAADAVLIVDDDRASLDLLAIYLDGYPVEVLRAHDGREALDVVGRARPRAVVLDIRLPEVDGWQVLEELRADPATAGLPVIVVSVVDERPRGLALGASDYLMKPVQRAELVGALRRLGALPEPKAATAPTGVGS